MHLPDEILAYIKEFSRPITRPDWRHLRRMTAYRFHSAILYIYNQKPYPIVIYNFICKYSRSPQDRFTYLFDYDFVDNRGRTRIIAHLLRN